MNEPEWLDRDVVLAIHDQQLAEHGGLSGIRDQGLLDSALARPRHLWNYSAGAQLHDLATSYAGGIERNQAFIDGNKRTAWVLCAVFLELNGSHVIADQAAVVQKMLALAAGELNETDFAAWLREPSVTR